MPCAGDLRGLHEGVIFLRGDAAFDSPGGDAGLVDAARHVLHRSDVRVSLVGDRVALSSWVVEEKAGERRRPASAEPRVLNRCTDLVGLEVCSHPARRTTSDEHVFCSVHTVTGALQLCKERVEHLLSPKVHGGPGSVGGDVNDRMAHAPTKGCPVAVPEQHPVESRESRIERAVGVQRTAAPVPHVGQPVWELRGPAEHVVLSPAYATLLVEAPSTALKVNHPVVGVRRIRCWGVVHGWG